MKLIRENYKKVVSSEFIGYRYYFEKDDDFGGMGGEFSTVCHDYMIIDKRDKDLIGTYDTINLHHLIKKPVMPTIFDVDIEQEFLDKYADLSGVELLERYIKENIAVYVFTYDKKYAYCDEILAYRDKIKNVKKEFIEDAISHSLKEAKYSYFNSSLENINEKTNSFLLSLFVDYKNELDYSYSRTFSLKEGTDRYKEFILRIFKDKNLYSRYNIIKIGLSLVNEKSDLAEESKKEILDAILDSEVFNVKFFKDKNIYTSFFEVDSHDKIKRNEPYYKHLGNSKKMNSILIKLFKDKTVHAAYKLKNLCCLLGIENIIKKNEDNNKNLEAIDRWLNKNILNTFEPPVNFVIFNIDWALKHKDEFKGLPYLKTSSGIHEILVKPMADCTKTRFIRFIDINEKCKKLVEIIGEIPYSLVDELRKISRNEKEVFYNIPFLLEVSDKKYHGYIVDSLSTVISNSLARNIDLYKGTYLAENLFNNPLLLQILNNVLESAPSKRSLTKYVKALQKIDLEQALANLAQTTKNEDIKKVLVDTFYI